MGILTGLAAMAAFAVVAPLAAWLGRKHGSRLKGGAALLLGLGSFYDPPKRHLAEAHETKEEEAEDSGEPLDRRPRGG